MAKFWCTKVEKVSTCAVDHEDENIHITRASVSNADKLKEGSRGTLMCRLNTDGEDVWTAVTRFCIGREESAMVMVVVPCGESVEFKVMGGDLEVDLSGYTGTSDDMHDDYDENVSEEEEEEEEEDDEEEDEEEDDEGKGGAKRPASLEEPPAKKAKGTDGKASATSTPTPTAAKAGAAAGGLTKAGGGSAAASGTSGASGASSVASPAAAKTPDFIPSPKFTGSKAGMVYKKDSKGLGYYTDEKAKGTSSAVAPRVPGQPKTPSTADDWASKKVDAMEWKTMTGGLKYRDTVPGKGAAIRKGMTAQMHYTGKLSKNGKQFDSSVGKSPFSFRYGAGEVIKGWDLGLEGMREGGKRTLVIPSGLGYGKRGAGRDIPPNSDLTFDVQLIKCK